MSHTSLASGGNQWAIPGDAPGASATGYTNVRPAEHHQRRFYTIEKHINTGARPFYGTEGPLITLESGDTFDTHLIGAPAVIQAVTLHLRKGIDTTDTSVNKGATAKLKVWIQDQDDENFKVTLVDRTGAEAVVDLTVGEDGFNGGDVLMFFPKAEGVSYSTVTIPARTVTVPSQTVQVGESNVTIPAQTVTVPAESTEVQVSPAGGIHLNTDRVLKVMFSYEAKVADDAPEGSEAPIFSGCFGVVAHYTWLEDSHECTCAPVVCDTTYPDPDCVPRP